MILAIVVAFRIFPVHMDVFGEQLRSYSSFPCCYCYEFTISQSDIDELGTVAVNAQNCSADYVSLIFPAAGTYQRCLMRVLSGLYFTVDYSVAPNSSYTGPNAPCRNDGECP